jgi:Alcohol dehydrogenase GroES-like domain
MSMFPNRAPEKSSFELQRAACAEPTFTSWTVSCLNAEARSHRGHELVGRMRGACEYCTSGRENLCERARFTGCHVDGGYAEYAVADERYCLPIPQRYGDADEVRRRTNDRPVRGERRSESVAKLTRRRRALHGTRRARSHQDHGANPEGAAVLVP